MLIQLRVENHRSLRDEVVLSLVASSEAGEGCWDPGVPNFQERVLPVAAIWGANASGKSNLLHALAWMHVAVLSSFRYWGPDDGVPREPFAFREEQQALDSLFEVELALDGARYTYGFTVNDQEVTEEWLLDWPHGERRTLFARDRQVFEHGEALGGHPALVAEMTRSNGLFLSAGAQANHRLLTRVYQWFSQELALVGMPLGWTPDPARIEGLLRAGRDDAHADSFALQFLRRADLGISGIRVVDGPASARGRLWFRHVAEGADRETWLPLERQSLGTIGLVAMLPALNQVLSGGGVLVVDELDASLHPALAADIIQTFRDPERNPRRAQLVFNTHDATLIGDLNGQPLLRRDEIWFAEKDRAGVTRVVPLSDFHPVAGENRERSYLNGRYGAVPLLKGWSDPGEDGDGQT